MRLIYSESYEDIEAKTGRCGKCGGSGYIPRYKTTKGGICFRCQGTGKTRDCTLNSEIHKQRKIIKVVDRQRIGIQIKEGRKKIREAKEEEIIN
ncbi:MAG: hypothetical protein E7211_16965 [Clostridium lundense]|nr:hypothetical protein [Clostridium lundense]